MSVTRLLSDMMKLKYFDLHKEKRCNTCCFAKSKLVIDIKEKQLVESLHVQCLKMGCLKYRFGEFFF